MNGWERLQALSTGQPVDRIPIFCNLLDQGAAELGISIKDYYANAENVAEAQLRMREKYGYDNLWGLFYVGREAEILGCRNIVFSDNGPPNVGQMIIKSARDIENLEIPEDIYAHPAFEQSRRCLEILRREAGDRYPVCAFVSSSTSLPAMLMGAEKWLELLLFGPASLRDEMLAKCSLFVQRHIQACRKAGAQLCGYAAPFSTPGMLGPSLYRSVGLPWLRKDLALDGPADIVMHGGGMPLGPVLADVLEGLPLAACYLHPFDDIAEAKKQIAGRVLCCGTLNDIKLLSWTGDQIETEVQRILAAGLPGGKFCFGTFVMPFDIPPANIRRMIDAVTRYCNHER